MTESHNAPPPAASQSMPCPPPAAEPPATGFGQPPATPSSGAAVQGSNGGRPPIMLARTLLAVAVLVGIVAVFISGGPGAALDAGPERWDAMISAAETRSDLNNANTAGAPQQQVVNGWHANDLLTIQAEQNTALLQAVDRSEQIQDRNGKILALLAIGLIGHLMFSAGSELGSRRRV